MHILVKGTATLLTALVAANVLSADTVYDWRLGFNTSYTQTSDTAPTTPSGYFFSADALFTSGGILPAITAGTVTFPATSGLSPQALTVDPGDAIYEHRTLLL
jgi:hypothetical protein